MTDRPEHNQEGNPCKRCGKSAYVHRVSHKPQGAPCAKCGLPSANHRPYSARSESWKDRHNEYIPHPRPQIASTRRTNRQRDILYVGVDGEGQGRRYHRYVLLGACTRDGRAWTLENPNGIGTVEALDFLLNLPVPSRRCKIFSYSFNYDLTKFLQDVDNESLYKLFRPELRQRHGVDARKGPWPVRWKGYLLNLQGTKFTVSKGKRRIVVWDLFKFYQSKFVSALESWNVGTPEAREHMKHMKDKREDFDKESPDAVKTYCLQECQYMAELGYRLVKAHEDAGLELKSFYGAGSSGKAILQCMGIRSQIKLPPEEMREAVAAAFFGGRFENSVIGRIHSRVFNRDISSAYPYHITFLPCLVHGTWERTTDRRRVDGRSLVRYSLEYSPKTTAWAPFPFRTKDGSICFPNGSGGGWVWGEEYLAGERAYPGVVFHEAWVYCQNCDCQPFARMPHYYRERCRIGKEGAGIVLKLGPNSVYGALAQSVGNPIFQSWIWAGMTTSGCRAQSLDLISSHHDRSAVLMVATDGIMSLEDVAAPKPKDTGTWNCNTGDGKAKPLGGWERDVIPQGIFLARPGIYFPLEPTEKDIKKVKGRGIGKATALENWRKIVEAWEKGDKTVHVANVSRFCGAKTSISHSSKGYRRAQGTGSEPSYGQWISRSVEMSFDPMPKRECVNADGQTLKLRTMPKDLTSVPYGKAIRSQESRLLAEAEQEMIEQPDPDLSDYQYQEN